MSLACYCDYDPPDFHSSRIVRARKAYRCYECGKPIAIGERHEYAFGIVDGYSYQPRTCTHCLDIRQFVVNNIPCFCWAHGTLISDAREIISRAYEEAPDEVKGVAFGLGRLLVKARRARVPA